MTERKNLPAVIATQSVAVLTEQRGSLVARGMDALRKDNDALYRQARLVFDRREIKNGWDAADNPAIFAAFKIFRQLADQDYGKAYYPLSYLYRRCQNIKDGEALAKHYTQMAFDWCFANQANLDVELWCILGTMYCNGHGVGQNYEQALYWFRKAAEQGHARGQYNFGFIYYEGRGVEKNNGRAAYWFRKAAEQGNARGQVKLGFMYTNGRGVEQNYELAVYWSRKAAEQDNAYGQWNLGAMYMLGRGVEQNDEQAVNWFRKAAEQGNAYAQEDLIKLGIDWNK